MTTVAFGNQQQNTKPNIENIRFILQKKNYVHSYIQILYNISFMADIIMKHPKQFIYNIISYRCKKKMEYKICTISQYFLL